MGIHSIVKAMKKSFKLLILVLMLGLVFVFVGCTKSVTKITLSGSDEGFEGDKITLTATLEPEGAKGTVEWSSSDTEKATVSNGVVTLIKEGKVTITAAVGDVKGEKEITINKKPVDVTSVTVTGDTTVKVGNTIQLTANVAPDDATDKTVTWESSDPEKATVDQTGLVTGVAEGEVTITAKAGEQSGTLTVTVTPAKIEVESVKIEGATEVRVGESIPLSAVITPRNATEKTVSWTSSDQTKATVSETGRVTGVAEGQVTITATVDGKSATYNVTVISSHPVAMIGEEEYSTLDEAFKALAEGDVLDVIEWAEGTYTVSANNVTIQPQDPDNPVVIDCGKIKLADNLEGLTIQNFEFTGTAQIEGPVTFDNFKFINNNVHDITLKGEFQPGGKNNTQHVAFMNMYSLTSGPIQGNLTVKGNNFENMACLVLYCGRTGDNKKTLITENTFKNIAITSINQNGGYNNGTLEITHNVFENEEGKEGYGALNLRSIGAEAGHEEHIIIEWNTFKNIGKEGFTPTEGHPGSCVISCDAYQENQGNVVIRYNEFVDCLNGIFLRDNGDNKGQNTNDYYCMISYNLFKNISGYIARGDSGFRRNQLEHNAYVDETGAALGPDVIAEKIYDVKSNTDELGTEENYKAAVGLIKVGISINGTYYESFAAALEAAQDGDTIVLDSGADIQITSNLTINKSITISGPNKDVRPGEERFTEAVITVADDYSIILGADNIVFEGVEITCTGQYPKTFQYEKIENFTLRNCYLYKTNTVLKFKADDEASSSIKGKILMEYNVFESVTQFIVWISKPTGKDLEEFSYHHNSLIGSKTLYVGIGGAFRFRSENVNLKINILSNTFENCNLSGGDNSCMFEIDHGNATIRFNVFKASLTSRLFVASSNKAETSNLDDNLVIDSEGQVVTSIDGFTGKLSESLEAMQAEEAKFYTPDTEKSTAE